MQAFLVQRLPVEEDTDRPQRIGSDAETIQRAGERMSRLLVDLTDMTRGSSRVAIVTCRRAAGVAPRGYCAV